MTGDLLEFRISQLADGTLPEGERPAVQAAVDADASARQTLEQYRRLNQQMSRTLSTPPIRWGALAAQLSAAVASVEAGQPAVAGRIVRTVPVWSRRLGVAASVAIVAGAALIASRNHHGGVGVAKPAVTPPSSVVIGPQAEVARGTSSVQITISPSPTLAQQGGEWRYAEGGVVTAPPKVQYFSKASPPAPGESHLH